MLTLGYNRGVTSFEQRYKKLNKTQQQAVDTIDGPLLVIAGPGTGKTELLSMRAANILRTTDTLPESILCLTFTDSGASAMRSRLAEIIGPDAYKVAIHTFHSFGTEIINQNNQYFYHGATYKPADELTSYEILSGIFDELDYTNPLASKNNGDYTHLADAVKAISELKQAGLTSDELLAIITENERTLDEIEGELSAIFANKISSSMLSLLAPLAQRAANIPRRALPLAITPLANVLSLSMARMFDAAVASNKTTPITAWRNEWLEKNEDGVFVFKDRKRHQKLRAMCHIYFAYLSRMEQAGLYDYDDMILNVVHGMETQPDLRYNLQEKYQYIMVDEFQDTNLAQLRILFSLTNNPAAEGKPNVMAVGDDDQAIYSFQGADVNNIHRFLDQYGRPEPLVLTDNYRSTQAIIDTARSVIAQNNNRLEATLPNLSKALKAHVATASAPELHEFSASTDERAWLANDIAQKISNGTAPSSIAVIARQHSELIELLPYLYQHNISVNYERRDNVLDNEVIRSIDLTASIVLAIHDGRLDEADALLPQLLAHPAFGFTPESVWRASLASYRNHLTWLEVMATTPDFVPLHSWLLALAQKSAHLPLEQCIDEIIGSPAAVGEEVKVYQSPFYEYYFGANVLARTPDAYLVTLDALRTIRMKLREYKPTSTLLLADYLAFVETHRAIGSTITSIRRQSDQLEGAITVMTAHKSKGLEYPTVYIVGAIDSKWGERVRSRSRLIAYPENLQISPIGNTYAERLRLFYVAMTRAKKELIISYATADDGGKDTLPASFLTGTALTATNEKVHTQLSDLTEQAQLAWHQALTHAPTATMKQLLEPQLETYKLSITHLNNFIDITRGGPTAFLMNNLLHFPQAKSANASYGTAVHTTLQRAHNHIRATGEKRPIEDIVGDFNRELANQHLSEEDFTTYSKKGADSLNAFLHTHYTTFSATQQTERNFANQGVVIGKARLTGSLDLIDTSDETITVTDYKTGKPSSSWQGKTDYEKLKLHKYKQQLMFYQLLIQNARDYRRYSYNRGVLQFVEPDIRGTIHALELTSTPDDLHRFTLLIEAIWQRIITLDFPDTSAYDSSYKGVLAFEQWLIDNTS